MASVCPCCGAVSSAPIKTELAARELPPVQSAILRALARDFGSYVPTARIAQIVWANAPNGGPEGFGVSISQAVKRMRPKLADHGLTAEARQYLGYRVRAA